MKRVRKLLQEEVQSKSSDLESLANQLARNKRQLIVTLDSVQVAREQAEQASTVKTDFLQMVSHEFRTPLATVYLEAQRLERSPDIGKSEQAGVNRILRSCKRLSDLIESLLDYSQIERGRLSLNIEELDCEELCRGLLEELRPQAESQGLQTRLTCVANLPTLKSDLRLIRLVIVNLLTNAIKFTTQGTIEVTIGYTDGIHRIQVRDTGSGIPVDEQSRIYEPFWHREPVNQKHTPGTGLGLAIVKQLVQALGGTIDLDSKPGAGCTFTVALPRYRKMVASVNGPGDSEPMPSFEAQLPIA
jgi:signal transduction histidine kinase